MTCTDIILYIYILFNHDSNLSVILHRAHFADIEHSRSAMWFLRDDASWQCAEGLGSVGWFREREQLHDILEMILNFEDTHMLCLKDAGHCTESSPEHCRSSLENSPNIGWKLFVDYWYVFICIHLPFPSHRDHTSWKYVSAQHSSALAWLQVVARTQTWNLASDLAQPWFAWRTVLKAGIGPRRFRKHTQ